MLVNCWNVNCVESGLGVGGYVSSENISDQHGGCYVKGVLSIYLVVYIFNAR